LYNSIVEFESYDDVKEALRTLDRAELRGQKIYLKDVSYLFFYKIIFNNNKRKKFFKVLLFY